MLEAPASPPPGSTVNVNVNPNTNTNNDSDADGSNAANDISPKSLAAKQRKREKDRVRAQQKRQLLQDQSDELKVLKEQFSGVSETLNIIKDIMGADSTDVATQIRTMATIVGNARSLIEALPHNSELRRPITKWLIRSLNPSEACRIFGLSRAAYYRAYHSKEEKLMANASGYHHQHRRTYNPPDPNATAATIAAAVAMIQPNDEPLSPEECDPEAPLSPNSMRASSIHMESSLAIYPTGNGSNGQVLPFPHLQQLQPVSMPSSVPQRQQQHQSRMQHHTQQSSQQHSHPHHPQHHPHQHHSPHVHHGQLGIQQASQRHVHFQTPRAASVSPQQKTQQPHQTHPSPPQQQPQTQVHLHQQSSPHTTSEQAQPSDDNMPSLLSVVAEAGAQTLEQQQAQQEAHNKRQRTSL